MTRKAQIWINGVAVNPDLYLTEIRFGGRQQRKTDALERAPRQAYDLDGAATVVATGETALGDRTVKVDRQHVLPPQLDVLEIGTATGTDFEQFAAETKRQIEAVAGLPPSVLRGDEP